MEQILLTVRELKRYEIVQARLKSGCKIEKILSDYDISKRTFYSNLHKFEKEGIRGLKSKWGRHKKTKDEKEREFEKLFNAHPYFSSYDFSTLIHLNPRTIQRIIKRRKMIKLYKPKKERAHRYDKRDFWNDINSNNICYIKKKNGEYVRWRNTINGH